MFQPTEYLLQTMTCALSGKGTKRLPLDGTIMFLVSVFVFDNIGLYFLCIITWFTHTPSIVILCSNKGFDVEISVINQLDAQTFCFTISLFHASTCFEHTCSSSGGHGYHSNPTTPKHQHTSNQEHYDQCGNSRE